MCLSPSLQVPIRRPFGGRTKEADNDEQRTKAARMKPGCLVVRERVAMSMFGELWITSRLHPLIVRLH
jgi:hypothetical protein